MEKRKLSGKTILKLVGALLALAYLGFCLYAGITGKFPNMHRVEHVMRFGDLKNWVSGGISAVMIFALCITSAFNDLNLQKGRKKSFLPLFLTMILPIILLLLLESYLDIGWIGIALYGHIDNDTPSLAMSVCPQYRGLGIGTSLLKQLLQVERLAGYSKISLSVQKSNYAVKMYEKVGFTVVNENSEEFIMIVNL